MVAFCAYISFLIDVANFLKTFYDEEFFFGADLAGSLARLVFAAFLQDGPFDVRGRVELLIPNIG